MTAQQPDSILARVIGHRRRHLKRGALERQTDIRSPPIAFLGETHADNGGLGTTKNGFAPRVVRAKVKCSIGRQELSKNAFLPANPGQVTKELQMLTTDAGDHPDLRIDQPHERLQFAVMIGAHFEHGRLMFPLQP